MGSTPRGISASRGAAVLGLSEFQTPLEVFQRIMEEREPGWNAAHGYALPDEPDSAAMRWGTAFESAVIELAEREWGKPIIDREGFYSSNEYITCHIDGAYYEGKYAVDCLHEGKTTTAFTFREKWGEPGTDHIPRAYQVQAQHQMLCSGAKEAIVSVLVFPETPDAWERMGWEVVFDNNCKEFFVQNGQLKAKNPESSYLYRPPEWADILCAIGYFHQYPVQANREAQKLMVEAYHEFWHNHVLTGKPPEPRNYEDVKRLFTRPVGTIVCDTAMTAWWMEYGAIRKEIGKSGDASKRQEKLKLRILDRARKMNPVMDDESQEKVIFRDVSGNKLGQYSKAGGFR